MESRGAARLAPGLRPRLPAAAASPLPSTAAAERHPPGARASRPHPSSCKEPPVHGHSLAKRTKPAFTGFSSLVPGFVRARRPRSRGSCAGGTPAFPGGLVRARRPRSRGVLPRRPRFDRLHCLHRLIREGCQRNERCEKSLQCTSSAMEADGLFVHQQRSDASLIPGIHTNGKLCFWNESPTLTAYLGWSSPGSAGVPPASFFLQRASRPRPLPRKAHQTRLYGVLFPRARLCAGGTPAFPGGLCAGETPALPGGLVRAGRPRSPGFPGGLVRARRPRSQGVLFDRLHCLHRLIREGCQRNERCEKSLQCTSSAMEADGLFVHQQRSDASLIPGIHTNGKLCFWNESPTLTAYLGWSSPGSAGVPPASFFLQRASRPRPLPRKAHQTRLYGVLFPRARLCAGETPAFPGGLVRAGRPRSRVVFTPTPFPSLGRPVPNLLQPLRAPSWIIPYPPPASARRCRVASRSISRLPGRRTTP